MGRLMAMAFQHWHDVSTTAEAGKQGSVLCSGWGARAVPQPAPVPPDRDRPCSGQQYWWLGFVWWKQAAKSWMLIMPHCLLPCFYPCRIFHPLKPTKRSYFPSVSETPSFFPDFPFHAVWILLRSLYTKAEYWLYDALRDLKGCCHSVTKLWGHFISTRSSLEDCG